MRGLDAGPGERARRERGACPRSRSRARACGHGRPRSERLPGARTPRRRGSPDSEPSDPSSARTIVRVHGNTSVSFSPWSRVGLRAASGRVPNSCAGFPYGGSWRPPMAVRPVGGSLEPSPSPAEVRDERPATASRRDCRRRGGSARDRARPAHAGARADGDHARRPDRPVPVPGRGGRRAVRPRRGAPVRPGVDRARHRRHAAAWCAHGRRCREPNGDPRRRREDRVRRHRRRMRGPGEPGRARSAGLRRPGGRRGPAQARRRDRRRRRPRRGVRRSRRASAGRFPHTSSRS